MMRAFLSLQGEFPCGPSGWIDVDSLVIRVEKIEKPRQEFRRALSAEWLGEVLGEAPRWAVRGEAELVTHLSRVEGKRVIVEGQTRVATRTPCRRCLREVESALPVDFTLNLVVKARDTGASHEVEDDGEGERAGTFDADEANEELFDGEEVDLAPIVREQILLALPAIEPLCKETCLGLCVECGQDLNERDCGHSRRAPDPRWAALEKIKLN